MVNISWAGGLSGYLLMPAGCAGGKTHLNVSADSAEKLCTSCQTLCPSKHWFIGVIDTYHIFSLETPQGIRMTQKMVDASLWLQKLDS